MADQKPTSKYYSNLGGVNLKNSEYTLEQTQFLDLRNVDFDVPGALSKRPGSSQAVAVNTSGPVIGLFEYKQLAGASYVVAGTDTALFYLSANAYTLLDTGWNNGQPQDFLTFVNKMWVASGQKFKAWDGGASFGFLDVQMPCPMTVLRTDQLGGGGGASWWLTAGATTIKAPPASSANKIMKAVFAAYSYIRTDGHYGPIDFQTYARNIAQGYPQTSGLEFFSSAELPYTSPYITGFTAPPGISTIALWVAYDTISGPSNTGSATLATSTSGSALGNADYTLIPNASVSNFRLFTTIPVANLFTLPTGWGTTFLPVGTVSTTSFSGVPFCYYNTFTPKYIDVNQNVMFFSGFSNAPSVLTFSDIGQPESVQPDYNFEVRTNDGDRIMGHRTYNSNVIVFKEESFHKVIGSTPEDFQLVELSTEFGCLSNNAIVEYNEKLLFLDRKGIIRFDGSGWQCISDAIDEVFRRMNLSAARENAVGVHHNYRNQVWFGIPVDGATRNNLTVVYDYLIDAWTFFDGYDASSYSFIKGALNKPTVWRGSYSGMIYYTGESFFGDNGQGITALAYSKFEQFNGENSTNVWRRLFLDVANAPGGITGTIQGNIFSDYDHSTIKATFSMPQNAFQSKAEVGVVGKAVAVQFSHYSASLPLLLNGFTWAKRNLRNV